MKTKIFKHPNTKTSLQFMLLAVIFLIQFFFFLSADAQVKKSNKPSLQQDLNQLNDNKAIQDRVRNMETSQRTRIVQNRSVDRNNRLELFGQLGMNNNADTYVQTQNTGLGLYFHFNPQWSVGLEYQKFNNNLTSEGQRQLDEAQAAQNKDPNSQQKYPGIDYPLDSKMAVVSIYPIYGKLNLFDSGVAQFDLYGNLGVGQMSLRSGNTTTMMAGLGAGIWFNQYFTGRLEGRYLRYTDLIQSTNRQENVFQLVASIGFFVW